MAYLKCWQPELSCGGDPEEKSSSLRTRVREGEGPAGEPRVAAMIEGSIRVAHQAPSHWCCGRFSPLLLLVLLPLALALALLLLLLTKLDRRSSRVCLRIIPMLIFEQRGRQQTKICAPGSSFGRSLTIFVRAHDCAAAADAGADARRRMMIRFRCEWSRISTKTSVVPASKLVHFGETESAIYVTGEESECVTHCAY